MSAWWGVLFATAAAFGFGISFNLHGHKLWVAAVGGGCGWLFYLLCAPLGEMMQYFIASVSITLYAELMARVLRAPVTVFLAPALIPLVPGGQIYETMLFALNGQDELFLSTGLRALTLTGALALGVVAASSVLRLFGLRRLQPHRPM